MKVIVPVILLIACIALGVSWYKTKNAAVDQKQKNEAEIVQLSNEVRQTRTLLEEQQTVNLTLEGDLTVRKNELQSLSNNLKTVSANLTRTQAEAKADAEAAAAEIARRDAEIARRDAEIAELEGQREDLTGQMSSLNDAIGRLEGQIADTEQKLAVSEGDREFLLAELKRLQVEKAELERQFNDLAILRQQVKRLREELSIARRLEWIRRGVYATHNQKGAERLVRGVRPAPPAPATPASDLEVELTQDGEVTIKTPAAGETP